SGEPFVSELGVSSAGSVASGTSPGVDSGSWVVIGCAGGGAGLLQDAPFANPPTGAFARRDSVAGPYTPSSAITSPGLFRFHNLWNAFTESPRRSTVPPPM